MAEKNVSFVDIRDEQLMVSLGIHPPFLKPRDPAVWTKTDQEKALLKKLRKAHKKQKFYGNIPSKPIHIYGKLLITIQKHDDYATTDKNGKKWYKTTFSHNCAQSDIPYFIRKYSDNHGTIVIKYNWLGKEYKAKDLPFWY